MHAGCCWSWTSCCSPVNRFSEVTTCRGVLLYATSSLKLSQATNCEYDRHNTITGGRLYVRLVVPQNLSTLSFVIVTSKHTVQLVRSWFVVGRRASQSVFVAVLLRVARMPIFSTTCRVVHQKSSVAFNVNSIISNFEDIQYHTT